jgi:hypothetical protein
MLASPQRPARHATKRTSLRRSRRHLRGPAKPHGAKLRLLRHETYDSTPSREQIASRSLESTTGALDGGRRRRAAWRRHQETTSFRMSVLARASRRNPHHQFAGDRQSHVQTVVLLDQRQGQINASGNARRGIERTILQKDRAGVDDQRRIALC